jgi:hypothetical protein
VNLTGSRYYDTTSTAVASILSILNKVTGDTLTLSGSVTLAGAGVGTQNITSFTGLTLGGTSEPDYTLTGASGSVTINLRPTQITYNGPFVGNFGVCIQATANLVDIGPGALAGPISGATVTVTINNSPYNNSGTAVTDGNGNAYALVPLANAPTVLPQPFSAIAAFAGDSIHASIASTPQNFTMNPQLVTGYPAAASVYTGQDFFWTVSPSSSAASLALSATLADTANDCAANITKANLTFYSSPTGSGNWTPLTGTLPVGLVTPGNYTVGTAATTVQYNIGNANNATFFLGVSVGGAYTLSPIYEIDLVSISKAVPGTICGIGTLDNNNAAGLLPGFQIGNGNSVTAVGVQYTKSGSNPQGSVCIKVTSGGKVYAIKSTSISTFSVNTSANPPASNFSSKCVIQDITNPNSPISIDGGALLQVAIIAGKTGVGQLAVSVQNTKTGGMWFTSDWNGSSTIQKAITGAKDLLTVQ